MASVTNRNSKKYRHLGVDDDEAPDPEESEATLLVKELAQKQSSKQTSLAEQLSLKQNFVQSRSDVLSVSHLPAGSTSLVVFSATSKRLDDEKTLLSNGFLPDEIEFLWDLKKGKQFVKSKHCKVDPAALERKINYILGKLGGPAEFSCPGPVETDLTSTSDLPLNDPRYDEENQMSRDIEYIKNVDSLKPFLKESEPEQITFLKDGESQWDKKQQKRYKNPKLNKEIVIKTCAPQSYYTIKDGKTVFLGRNAIIEDSKVGAQGKILPGTSYVAPNQTSLVSLEVIKNDRVGDVAEIRKIPKFQNYEKGTPCNILFVKNLAAAVSENDLTALFGHFEIKEGPAIVYRLMGGKMKGQAFITFPDAETAEKALNTINGYQLKGRPIIIQFGRKGGHTSNH
ncbi:RNA-binding protein 41-like [Neocloeon triangulifer]|uniref:RNA-binding protein 41-like n=1 Tax=Neocloeon triangulifer TaxID=2078957 RepID=UPI00286F9127|nr:RNA-binding protein 41-like [Neocloeon triangulifer]XP_059481841.1 RNA-binding protein 41-like [Neocloeon triangulifer]